MTWQSSIFVAHPSLFFLLSRSPPVPTETGRRRAQRPLPAIRYQRRHNEDGHARRFGDASDQVLGTIPGMPSAAKVASSVVRTEVKRAQRILNGVAPIAVMIYSNARMKPIRLWQCIIEFKIAFDFCLILRYCQIYWRI